ncbi:hypothetical protein FA09DRAFT_184552 [Tilletiopsis washingtonensis]|jgi:hypothetical protein|uniref:Uncharacterized protein n=1 Tax=Tilletiopsis washingtonensis TaxID=58919 RepID=A0A316ZHH4_9BASI|nr:hypothetical protein FA09DRAFT_184552 [Tilletiopsis washingtonensis]PWO00383.1 hypothetical protein FA09DRAFT_184552 [Tilletiopsis washingtonensis]
MLPCLALSASPPSLPLLALLLLTHLPHVIVLSYYTSHARSALRPTACARLDLVEAASSAPRRSSEASSTCTRSSGPSPYLGLRPPPQLALQLLAAAPPRRSGVASPDARCADAGPAVARRQPEDEVTGGAWRAQGVAMAPSDAAGVGARHERRPGCCSTSAGTTPPQPHHTPLRRPLRPIRPYRRADDIFQACARSRQASPLRRKASLLLPTSVRTPASPPPHRHATRPAPPSHEGPGTAAEQLMAHAMAQRRA